jgi:hypothetical protein
MGISRPQRTPRHRSDPTALARPGLGVTNAAGTPSGVARCFRAHQQGDRRPAVPLPPNRGRPPASSVPDPRDSDARCPAGSRSRRVSLNAALPERNGGARRPSRKCAAGTLTRLDTAKDTPKNGARTAATPSRSGQAEQQMVCAVIDHSRQPLLRLHKFLACARPRADRSVRPGRPPSHFRLSPG